MPPLRHIRKSRRLSIKSLLNDCQVLSDPLELLHGGPDVVITAPHVLSSPSASTTTSSSTPPSVLTHLPFTPGSSHTRNRKEGHIPRPPNAFMVFRSWLWNKDNLKSIEKDNRNVSRIAGRCWNELSEVERAPFRSMAEEAKARHAQLYPEYRYAPGSQKRPKVVLQRRSQRAAETETDKCKKLADFLLGGVASRNLSKYLNDDPAKVTREHEDASELVSESTPSASHPRKVPKKTAAPRASSPLPQRRSRKQRKTPDSQPIPIPPFQPESSLPLLTAADDAFENTPTPTLAPAMHTPELVYPLDVVDEFVATDDIPYLSLDDSGNMTMKVEENNDPSSFVPSHMKPAANTVFAGIKPESISFADSCVFGAYTANPGTGFSPIPFTNFDASMYEALAPLGSPMFTNPFEPPSAEHEALLGTLDQLFGQPISPFTLPGEW